MAKKATNKTKNNRAISVSELLNKKRRLLQFTGAMLNSFGEPELESRWILWGAPGCGKTSLALQIAKYMCELGYRVAYDSLEQGNSLSMANSIRNAGLEEVKTKFILLHKETIPDVINRFSKHKSPDVLIIDSIQFSRVKLDDYIDLKNKMKGKMMIIISHAKGKDPKGALAENIWYDAEVKIHVEGYKAFPMSRYGGENEYIIYPQGALEYWGFKKETSPSPPKEG